MKTILILGGSVMQLPALNAARNAGWKVLCADGNDKVIGKQYCDHFFPIDLKDRIALAEAAGEWKEKHGLDGVFTAGTDFSSTVAWIAQELALPGISFQTALNATDKVRMRLCFKEAGVPSARYQELDKTSSIEKAAEFVGFPLVVKPVDNMGARGVVRIDKMENMEEAVAEAIRYSRTGRAIVEEFLDGPEFSIDSLVFDDEVHICGFADRDIHFPPCFIETGHTIPSRYPDDVKEEIINVFKQGVKALGIEFGAAKGDMKLTSRGPVIGEIAARLSGGYMSGWTYPYSSGVNLTLEGMKLAMEESPDNLIPDKNEYCAERAVYSINGVVEEIRHIEQIYDADPLIKELFILVEEGDEVRFPQNNVEKCANWLAAGPDRELCVRAAEKAAAETFYRLKPRNPLTASFLEMEEGFPPKAFVFQNDENIKWFSDLEKNYMEWIFDSYTDMDKSELIITTPPCMDDPCRDWFGRSIKDAVEMVDRELSHLGISLIWPESEETTLADYFFWKAMIRGSIQGAVWVIESLLGE